MTANREFDLEGRPRDRFRALGGAAAEAAANVDPVILAEIEAEGTMLRDRDPIEVGAFRRWVIGALYHRYGSAGQVATAPPPAGSPMRVLRVVSNLTQGGVAKVCLQSVLAMDPAEVETTLLVFEEKKRQVLAFAGTVGIRVLPQLLRLSPGSSSPKFYRDIFRLSGIIRNLKPDVIHLHEPQFAPIVRISVGHAAQRGSRIPIIVHLHNDYRARTRSLPVTMMPLFRRALRESALIGCSETIHNAAADWLGPEGLALSLIEDGADDRLAGQKDDGMSDALKESAGDRLVLACMANLAPHKRVQDFIQACRILLDEGAPIFCLLMGYGKSSVGERTRAYFWERIASHEGEVLLRVGQPYSLFPRIGIGVSPSSLEGLGLNLLEYQIQGIPVVCTDLKPHREMVDHDVSGLMYPVGDVEALVACLRRLIPNPELRRRLGEGGRIAASRRKWSDTAASTTRLYRRILNGSA